MKTSPTYLLVGVLVAIAIFAIVQKHFLGSQDYDLPTQGNAIRFGIEGYEPADEDQTEGYEDNEGETDDDDDADADADDDAEHMTTAADAKRETKKVQAKLRAAAKKAKAAAAKAAKTGPAKAAAPEHFENTPRFQELKGKWDAYKAKTGPALSDAERTELLGLIDAAPAAAAAAAPPAEKAPEHFEQFDQEPYQGNEYAMF